MKWILIILMLVTPVNAFDESLIVPQGFDTELIVDYLPDEQIIFINGIAFTSPFLNGIPLPKETGNRRVPILPFI